MDVPGEILVRSWLSWGKSTMRIQESKAMLDLAPWHAAQTAKYLRKKNAIQTPAERATETATNDEQ